MTAQRFIDRQVSNEAVRRHAGRLSGRTDPATSKMAAERHIRSGAHHNQSARVLMAVLDAPGSTSGELADRMGLDRHKPARRLPELASEGLVARGARRACRVLGTQAVTWWPVDPVPQLSLFGGP